MLIWVRNDADLGPLHAAITEKFIFLHFSGERADLLPSAQSRVPRRPGELIDETGLRRIRILITSFDPDPY